MGPQLQAEIAAKMKVLASGPACPAGVGLTLDRIARGYRVPLSEVYYVTRTSTDADNFYARLRAAGFELSCSVVTEPADGAVSLADARPSVAEAARAYVAVLDDCARRKAEASRAYFTALGWAG